MYILSHLNDEDLLCMTMQDFLPPLLLAYLTFEKTRI